jgi:hypothetical protein
MAWIILGGIVLAILLAFIIETTYRWIKGPEPETTTILIEDKKLVLWIRGIPGKRPISAKRAPWETPGDLVDCDVNDEIIAIWKGTYPKEQPQ